MNPAQVVEIGRQLMLTALLLAGPAIIVSLAVGLAVSIFQAVTSIQEQTLTFAPRIVAVCVVLVLTLPWSLKVATNFAGQMLAHAAGAGR